MKHKDEKLASLKLGWDMPKATTSAVLNLLRWLFLLTVVQIFATVRAFYEKTSAFLLSFTIFRLYAIVVLLPVYVSQISFRLLPTAFRNIRSLMFPWDKLIEDTETHRRLWAIQVQLQLEGKYVFQKDDIVKFNRFNEYWMGHSQWSDNTKEFIVCGARVRYVHLTPAVGEGSLNGCSPQRPIVFLHGSQSWSHTWRKIMNDLVEDGHEVFSLDWLGHGLSDKPKHRESISFELHMRTLIAFMNHVQLKNAILVAHSWGGCVALCSIPRLSSSSCSGLFLINSFLPHRPHEISQKHCLLWAVWFLLTRVLHGYVSESTITRFISPNILEPEDKECEAAYRYLDANARPSVEEFAYAGTGISQSLLQDIRETPPWKIFEGLCGPKNFDQLNALALLSERGDNARDYWLNQQSTNISETTEGRLKIVAVFGERDPLVDNNKEVLVRAIGKHNMVDWAPDGIWLLNTGHCIMEDSSEDILRLIARLA